MADRFSILYTVFAILLHVTISHSNSLLLINFIYK